MFQCCFLKKLKSIPFQIFNIRKKAAYRPLFPRPCRQLVGLRPMPSLFAFSSEAWPLFLLVTKPSINTLQSLRSSLHLSRSSLQSLRSSHWSPRSSFRSPISPLRSPRHPSSHQGLPFGHQGLAFGHDV